MIKFAKSDDEKRVSEKSRDVIDDLLTTAGIHSAVVTRTYSTVEEQARAMYNNCRRLGVSSQLDLYGPYGDAVVHVFDRLNGNKPEAVVLSAMADEIRQLGPSNVSHHCADPKRLNVIDISASSLSKSESLALEAAIRKENRVVRHFSSHTVPYDPAFHIEIPQ